MTTTSRREALKLFAAAGGVAALTPAAFARAADPVFLDYAAASADDPWTLIVRDAPSQGFDGQAELINGRLPDGFAGTLYRNGPGRFSRQDWRYRHWFDGDGFLQSWQIGQDGINHRGRFIQTDKWQTEEAAGRFILPALGSVPPNPGGLSGPDDMNVANTSVLLLGDELLALWEGGSAWSIDPDTLDSRGARRWGQGLDGVPFSAHPKREPGSGIIWNFGQDASSERLVLWKIAPDGTLLNAGLVNDVPGGMIHDFVITERSLVFLVGSYRFQQMRLPFIESFQFDPEAPMRAIAVDKDDWSVRRSWDLPPGFLFHFGGAWEETDGTIRLDAALSQDARFAMAGAYDVMRGHAETDTDAQSRHMQVTLSPGGRSRIEALGDAYIEFPQIDPRQTGLRRRETWHVAWDADQPRGANRIERRNLHTGARDGFDHGAHVYVEEPLFVPAAADAAEGEGWIVHTALNALAQRTELHLFNAQQLSDGPVASWRLPYACPFGFHGCWRSA
jgi:carotenoid cleavage dioxygenase-like enzyme